MLVNAKSSNKNCSLSATRVCCGRRSEFTMQNIQARFQTEFIFFFGRRVRSAKKSHQCLKSTKDHILRHTLYNARDLYEYRNRSTSSNSPKYRYKKKLRMILLFCANSSSNRHYKKFDLHGQSATRFHLFRFV